MADFSEWQADVFEDFLAGAGGVSGVDAAGDFFLDDELPDSVTLGNLLADGNGKTTAESFLRNPPQIIQRNATLFLIDCSASMFAVATPPASIQPQAASPGATPNPPQPTALHHNIQKPFHHCQTPFSRAVTFARKFYEHSVLSNASATSGAASNKDLMSIVLYNTRERLNQYGFPGVFVFQEFDSPSAPRVQELDTLAKTGVFVVPNSGASGTSSTTTTTTATTSTLISVYAQKYEEFKTHIGHSDVIAFNADGSIKQEGGLSSSGAKNSGSCKLSDVFWNAQHMFHFLKSSTQTSGVAKAAANAGKSILYRFQKNVLVFTDKEDPIRTYASVLANQTLQDQLLSNNNNTSARGNAAQRLQVLLQMDSKAKVVYLKKVYELMKVERLKCESRVRDLIEEGVTLEILGYTSTSSPKSQQPPTAGQQLQITAPTAPKLPEFDPRKCWAPLLRSPYTSANEAAIQHQQLRGSLNSSGGGAINNSYPHVGGAGAHSSSSLGGVVPDSHQHVSVAPQAHNLASAAGTASSSKDVVLDWFATLGGDNVFASSSGGGDSAPNHHSGPGSVASQQSLRVNHLSSGGGKRGRSPGASSDGGGSSNAASSSIAPSSYYDSKNPQQTRGGGTATNAVATEVFEDDRCSARVLVFDRAVYKGMPKSIPNPQNQNQQDDDDDDLIEDEASHFFDSLSIARTYPRRPVGSLTMSFGPAGTNNTTNNQSQVSQLSTTAAGVVVAPTMAVQLYLPVVKCMKPRFSWRHATTNDAVVTKMKRISKTTGEEVPNNGANVIISDSPISPAEQIVKRVLYSGTVGGRRVLFSETEKQVIRSGTFIHPKTTATTGQSSTTATSAAASTTALSGASVRILCMRPYETAVRAKYSVGRCGFLHPQALPAKLAASVSSTSINAGSNSSKSLLEAEANNVKLFVGLHRVLLEKGLVAIAELSSVRRAPGTTTGASSSSSPNGAGLAENGGGGGGVLLNDPAASQQHSSSTSHMPNVAFQSAPRLVALVPAKLPTDQLDGVIPHPIYSHGITSNASSSLPTPIIPAGYFQSIQSAGGCGFHVIPLPYADDIRSLTAITKQFQLEDPRVTNPTKHAQLVSAAGTIIKKLSTPYAPSDLPNPALAHTYGMLQRLALMQDDDDEDDGEYVGHYDDQNNNNHSDDDTDGNTPILKLSKVPKEIQRSRALKKKRLNRQNMSDLTLPDFDGMARYQHLFSTFSTTAFSPHYDPDFIVPPPAGSAAAGGSAPLSTSEKATVAAGEIKKLDFDMMEQTGALTKLTIPLLAAYLKAEGAATSGKKQDLVDSVTKIIQKKRLAAGGVSPGVAAATGTVKTEQSQ